MKIGGKYNWKGQPERLAYLGKSGCWHQFEKVDEPGIVWCEVLDSDLHMIEETKEVDGCAPNLTMGEIIARCLETGEPYTLTPAEAQRFHDEFEARHLAATSDAETIAKLRSGVRTIPEYMMLVQEQRTEIAALEVRLDGVIDPLRKIKQWCEAYPLDVFPEPDFKKAAAVLKDAGMTIDAISASNMRHVLNGIVGHVDAALAAAPAED